MRLTIPQNVETKVQRYVDKVLRIPDAYINEDRTNTTVDPNDPSIPGVSEQFILQKDKENVYWNRVSLETNEESKLRVLYKPGGSTRDAIVEWLNTVVSSTYTFHSISGFFWYPPEQGFMGWHTNSDTVGVRIYLVYADRDHKSFFRYYDNQSGTVVTDWDKKGWNARCFTINNDPTDLYWHCVYSECNRISIGINYTPTT